MTLPPLHKRPIQHRSPKEFSIHEFVEHDPWLPVKDARLKAKEAAWREAGSFDPILALADGRIVSGRHRHRFATREGWEEIPWIEVTEDEVTMLAMRDLFAHHTKSKSQVAYLAAPKMEPLFKAAQQRRIAILQSGGKEKLPEVASVEALAKQLNVSDELLRQARRIHDVFGWTKASHKVDGKALKKEWEPKILSDSEPVNLGFVLAGIGSQIKTKGNKKNRPARNSALSNFLSAWKNQTKAAAHWKRWDDAEREQAKEGLVDAVAKLPEELLEEVAKAVRAAKRAKSESTGSKDNGEAPF